ncbi:hypothetical protein U9M48_007255 [Paspalum notatum var. saurae]|uniref:Uncharacterized protein n=1 Tax=Paspalum notatum var. saurae TaxID=547442 RepID=A0AAQ3PU52_PASNO
MDGSPVMTESERRAYRYGHHHQAAATKQRGMRKSWSNDSLAGGYGGHGAYAAGGRASCVCAPTTHPGSFRCKHHRHASNNLGAAAAPQPQVVGAPAADVKPDEHEAQETAPGADQVDRSP